MHYSDERHRNREIKQPGAGYRRFLHPPRSDRATSSPTADPPNDHAVHPPHPDTLGDVLDQAWSLLTRGVADRRHCFHTPVLVTTDDDGLPDARTVVLRRADRDGRVLGCHTDGRSPKVAQIGRQPVVAWHFYDAGGRVQLRCRGRTRVIDDPSDPALVEAWARTSAGSRVCYRAPEPPSTRTDAPASNQPPAEPDDPDEGLDNFRLVRTVLDRLEWLRLRHDGHRRALFTWDDAGACAATWLEP